MGRELLHDEDLNEKENRGKRMRLNSDEEKDLELMEKLDSESRRVYDPISKVRKGLLT